MAMFTWLLNLKEKIDARRRWKILSKNDPRTRSVAKNALVEIGTPAVPILIQVLKKPNRKFSDGTSLHSKAMRVLQLMRERAIEPLIDMLKDDNRVVSRIAEDLLYEMSDSNPRAAEALKQGEKTIARLLKDLKQKDKVVKVRAAEKLALIGEKKAIKPIIEAMEHASGPTKLVLARVLASTGDIRVLEPLKHAHKILSRIDICDEDTPFMYYIRRGTIHPNLQSKINRLTKKSWRGSLSISSTAKISHDKGGWTLRNVGKQYLLELNVSKSSFGPIYWMYIILPDDDIYLAPISEAIRKIESFHITDKKVGLNILKIRKERGLTQERLGALAGLHKTYIGQVERGEKNIVLKDLEKIAEALNVSIRLLVSDSSLEF